MSDRREDQQIIELLQRCLNQLTNINLSTNLMGELIQEVHAGNELLQILIRKETQMAGTLQDLDDAIAKDDTLETSLEQSIQANTAELEALKAAVTPDLQPRIDKILARQASQATAIQSLKDADTANAPTA